MKCRKCGQLISEDSKFCKICGAPQGGVEGMDIGNSVARAVVGAGKKALGVVGDAASEVILPEVSKAINKKSKKVTDKVLKKVRLKSKTPLDKIKEKVGKR